MTNPPFKFFVRRSDFFRTEMMFGRRLPSGELQVAQPVQMVTLEPEKSPGGPMLSFQEEDATDALQSLMDGLWELGIRPKDVGTAGHLASTQAHLQDMRRLVEHAGNFRFQEK